MLTYIIVWVRIPVRILYKIEPKLKPTVFFKLGNKTMGKKSGKNCLDRCWSFRISISSDKITIPDKEQFGMVMDGTCEIIRLCLDQVACGGKRKDKAIPKSLIQMQPKGIVLTIPLLII